MNILIPMAGEGSRFKTEGYTFPKPLIDVDGKPMIQVVTENLNIDADVSGRFERFSANLYSNRNHYMKNLH